MELKLLNRSSCLIYIPFYNLGHGHIHIRPGKKMSWFWSLGGSILTQIKKNAGRRINTTPRKIQSPVFSSPVNHQNPRSSAF